MVVRNVHEACLVSCPFFQMNDFSSLTPGVSFSYFPDSFPRCCFFNSLAHLTSSNLSTTITLSLTTSLVPSTSLSHIPVHRQRLIITDLRLRGVGLVELEAGLLMGVDVSSESPFSELSSLVVRLCTLN